MDCDACAKWVNRGPNCVPYGDTFVNEGDAYECSDGYGGDCPDGAFVPEEPHHSARCGHGLDEEDWERGDYGGDLEREANHAGRNTL